MWNPQQQRILDVILSPRQKDAIDAALNPSGFNAFLTQRDGEILLKVHREVLPLPRYFATTTNLRKLNKNDLLKEVTIKVEEAYPSGIEISVGFAANPEEVIKIGEVRLDRPGSYTFLPYRISTTTEFLTLYFYGGPPSSGRLTIVLEG